MTDNRQFIEFDSLTCELSGINLIEASAGTGKTYSIASLYLRFVLESNLPVESILVVTFTEAATAELKDRIRKRLKECLDLLKIDGLPEAVSISGSLSNLDENSRKLAVMKLEIALRTFDRASIFTIHGFCRRVLQEQAFETGSMFDFKLEPDLSALEAEIISDFLRSRFKSDSENSIYESKIFLRYLVDNGLFSGAIAKLVSKTRPFLKIQIKDFFSGSDQTEKAEKIFKESFEQARTMWNLQKQEIRTCLIESKTLNGTSYKDGTRKKLLENIEEYLAIEIPQPVLFKDFEKLSQTVITEKTKKGQIPPFHDFFNLCEDLKNAADQLAEIYLVELNSIKKDFMKYYSSESEKRKSINNTLGFNDLLLKVHDAIKGPLGEKISEGLRKRFRAALIDEFQDTDHIQYDIFSSAFKETTPLFLIGDPKQSIYGFRGADIFAYLKAASQADKKYTLTTNWRSDESLIKAVNTLFSIRENPFVFDGINYFNSRPANDKNGSEFKCADDRGSLEILAFSGKNSDSIKKPENLICEYVTDSISNLISEKTAISASISERPARPGDIAILVQKHRQGKKIKKYLDKAGIPSVSSGGDDVLKSVEAIHLSRLLAAVANPSDVGKLKAALTTPFFGKNAIEIAGLASDETALETAVLIFRELNEIWAKKDFIRMFRAAISRHGVMAGIASEPDGERILTNFFHLGEIINHHESSEKLSMDEVIAWLSEKIMAESAGSEEELLRLESEEDAVKIITIHKSKGLEFPIVFCPFPARDLSRMKEDGIVIHSSDGDESYTYFDVSHPDFKATQKKLKFEELAESARLLYVALTRAKHKCFIAIDTDSCCSSLGYLLFHDSKLDINDGIEDLKKSLGKTDFSEKTGILRDLSSKSDGNIFLSDYLENGHQGLNQKVTSEKTSLYLRKFDRRIKSGSVITSFSGITSRAHANRIDPDIPEFEIEDQSPKKIQSKTDEGKKTIFDFPKGAEAGNFFHSFIEGLDFGSGAETIKKFAETRLQEFGFDPEWAETVTEMAISMVSFKLKGINSNFSLSSINKDSRINEMGFYFPVRKMTASSLSAIFQNFSKDNHLDTMLSKNLENLEFININGFIHGFMDMFFEHQGYYYLVDWKSNHLGDTGDSYSPEKLDEIMISEFYILQYHLYIIALDRYLASRIPDYSYEKNFGGIFYLFIRGIDGTGKNGVYYHRPDKAFIEKLSSGLSG